MAVEQPAEKQETRPEDTDTEYRENPVSMIVQLTIGAIVVIVGGLVHVVVGLLMAIPMLVFSVFVSIVLGVRNAWHRIERNTRRRAAEEK